MQGLITVFGGTGFVGRYVVRSLARHGWRVRVAARKVHTAPELKVMGDVGQIELAQCNVRDKASVERALEGATGVVNLVGVLFESGKQGFQTLHTQAAAQIAELAAEQGITRFVQMSALGASPDSSALYAHTKAAGEQAVTMAIPSATILRPSIVFGPEDDFFNRFAQLATFAPVLPLIGGGHTRFQPVYAGDLGEAVARILDDPALQGRTYEIGGPGVYSFKTLLEMMLKEIQKTRVLLPLPFPVAGLVAKAGDIQAGLVPLAPMLTSDQLAMLKTDTVVTAGAPGLPEIGVEPTALEAVLPTYLWRYRRGGQFAQPGGHNA